MNFSKFVLGFFLICCCSFVQAEAITDAQRKAVNNALSQLSKQAGKKITATDIQSSPIPGLLQVTSDLSVFYVSSDGKYLFLGEMIDPSKDKMEWSLTEQAIRKLRLALLATVDAKNYIVFPASGKKVASVIVFFDIDCAYCHKLIEKIKDYTSAGLEIRILAFPRSGPNSVSYDKAIAVWCSSDPAQALDEAIKGNVPKDKCKTKAVDVGFELGRQIGIAGTPTMILPNGMKIPGLVEPQELVKMIKQ